ncbi:HEAT repeats [uncultured archaeon]|nr:HEAT repeats [uncultured archaeon]
MVPEKGTAASGGAHSPKANREAKGKQVSLLDAPEDKPDSIDSLVARAFDSDPRVRLKVAQDLGKIDDPRAVFALIELSSDKEEAVKEAAQQSLTHFKEEKEEIVSLGTLLAARKEAKTQPAASSAPAPVSQKMAPTIEKLFAHYEPKKRESVKRKLLPSLQKFFGFSKQELDPLQELEKISSSQLEEETEELPIRNLESKERIPP